MNQQMLEDIVGSRILGETIHVRPLDSELASGNHLDHTWDISEK